MSRRIASKSAITKTAAIIIAVVIVVAIFGAAYWYTRPPPTKELTVITWGGSYGDAMLKYIAKPFEEANPGVTVKIEYHPGASSATVARLRAEKANPTIDVYVSTLTGSVNAWLEGLVVPLKKELIPNLDLVETSAIIKSADGTIFAVAPSGETAGIAWRSDLTGVKEVTSWKWLWSPDLTLSMPDITYLDAHFIIQTALFFGGDEYNIDPGFEAWKELAPRIVALYKTEVDAAKNLITGEAEASLILNVNAFAASKESETHYAIPSDYPGLLEGEFVTVVKGGEEELAMKFVNFMLDPTNLSGYCNTLATTPFVKGVVTSPEIAEFAVVPKTGYVINATHVSLHLDEWIMRWNEEILPLIGG